MDTNIWIVNVIKTNQSNAHKEVIKVYNCLQLVI